MATITNLTPHAVTVRTEAGDRTFPASGQLARVSVNLEPAKSVDGLPCSTRKCGQVTGLPSEFGDDEFFIVSTMVFDAVSAQAAALREVVGFKESDMDYRAVHDLLTHLLVPDSGPDVIREQGQIVAVRRFIRA